MVISCSIDLKLQYFCPEQEIQHNVYIYLSYHCVTLTLRVHIFQIKTHGLNVSY